MSKLDLFYKNFVLLFPDFHFDAIFIAGFMRHLCCDSIHYASDNLTRRFFDFDKAKIEKVNGKLSRSKMTHVKPISVSPSPFFNKCKFFVKIFSTFE